MHVTLIISTNIKSLCYNNILSWSTCGTENRDGVMYLSDVSAATVTISSLSRVLSAPSTSARISGATLDASIMWGTSHGKRDILR